MGRIRIGLAQINATVGDLEGNVRRILEGIEQARRWGVDIVAFPELAVTGYPPEDLLFRSDLQSANLAALERIAPATRGLTAIVGFVDRQDDLYNGAAVLNEGNVAAVYHKMHLASGAGLDERRYFRPGYEAPVFHLREATFAVNVGDDIRHPGNPARDQALSGNADLILNIAASPYHAGKGVARERMLAQRAVDYVCYLAVCNLIGGQDGLVFDGHSVVVDPQGEIVARGRQFEEDFIVADVDLEAIRSRRLYDAGRREERAELRGVNGLPGIELHGLHRPLETRPALVLRPSGLLDPTEEVYRALVLGTRDYVRKNGFQKVLVGLSGGIDSALVACIAADALGHENVVGVFMPSPYTSAMSAEDVPQLATNLGLELRTIPITPAYDAYLHMLAESLAGRAPDVTEENLQPRIRANLLMALSNRFGWLVLATGNKSELSVGYATLYGDMAGGFAVLRDVPKTLVYELGRWRNARGEAIPQRILVREPTAELRPGQRDVDALPPYEVLDPILRLYLEEHQSPEEIIQRGFDPETVYRVAAMVDRSEYKRRQAPPGVRISASAFGQDRRLPITNRYRGH
ncbi:MAG: NAD+ synthase [Anaerolineae bacterium]|nr:NAD+ synthase [Anaerolineae bacterium]